MLLKVTSVTPDSEAAPAVACSDVQRREAVVVEPIKARPKPTLVKFKATPDGLATKSAPTVAERPVPPRVMTLTCTPVVVSLSAVPAVSAASLTVTAELLRWKAKLPLKRKKSPATTLAPVKATSCRPTAMAPNW